MGFIGQIVSIKAHGAESVHEKVTQMLKDNKEFLKVWNQEEENEKKIKIAEKEGKADEIFRLQKEEVKLAARGLEIIKHILVELFALGDDERKEIERFIVDGKRLEMSGLPKGQEEVILQQFKQQQMLLSEFFQATRYTSGMKR